MNDETFDGISFSRKVVYSCMWITYRRSLSVLDFSILVLNTNNGIMSNNIKYYKQKHLQIVKSSEETFVASQLSAAFNLMLSFIFYNWLNIGTKHNTFLKRTLLPYPQFHAMVLSCRSGFLDAMLGLNHSQHLALLTRRLYHCLADHTLLQVHKHLLTLLCTLNSSAPQWTI